MKKFIKKLLRTLFFFTYIFFVASAVGLASILIIKNNEYAKTQETLNINQQELEKANSGVNQQNLENKNTIDKLNSDIQGLKQKNSDLQSTVDSYLKVGEGLIQGKISGQIVLGQDNLSQYQLICAQNVANTNDILCKSVSAIKQTFELSLPAGKYMVYAKVLNKDNQVVLNEYSGKYTEYVKCLSEKAHGDCDVSLSKKQITIDVKPAQKVINVNPVDWN